MPLRAEVDKATRRAHRLVNDRWSEERADIRGNFFVYYDPQTGNRQATPEFFDRGEFYIAILASTYPDDLDLESVRVDPVTGTVRPNSVGIRQEVSA